MYFISCNFDRSGAEPSTLYIISNYINDKYYNRKLLTDVVSLLIMYAPTLKL